MTIQATMKVDCSGSPDCDCWRIASVLEYEEPLPDHVSWQACRASCEKWIHSAVPAQSKHIALIDGRMVDFGGINPKRPADPIPHWPCELLPHYRHLTQRSGYLWLTLREWVTHPLTLKQLRSIEESETWQKVLHLEQPSFLVNPNLDVADPTGIWQTQRRLAQAGLSATRATALYLRQLAARQAPSVEPTNGIIVISQFLVSYYIENVHGPNGLHQRGYGTPGEDEVLFKIAGSSLFLPNSLLNDAVQVIDKHREWWRELPNSNIPTKDGRKYNSGTKGDCLDADIDEYLSRPLTDEQKQQLIDKQYQRFADEFEGIHGFPPNRANHIKRVRDKVNARLRRRHRENPRR